MITLVLKLSVFRKFQFSASNHLFDFIRKNHFQPKVRKFVYKAVVQSKEKELLHEQLLASLQKCKTIEDQIKVFYSLIKLPEENIAQRYAVCEDLKKSLLPYFPSCSINLVGSSVNGFGFKGCDVDLSIQLPEESIHKSAAKNTSLNQEDTVVKSPMNKVFPSKNHLLTIRKILQELKYDEPLNVIPGRCPILSFTAQGLLCDLSINNKSALNGTNFMLLCGKLDERIIPLMQIVTYWAKNSKLVGGHSRFKTYAIFLMVVYFLQTRTPPVLPSVETMFEKTEFFKTIENWTYDVTPQLNKFEKSTNNQTVEQLLKQFFLFYGNFDFSYIICPINGTSVSRNSFDCTDKFELNTICIQDPFNLEWNVTTGVYWKVCKHFLKCLISVWEKYRDQNFWIPGSQHWGIASLINNEFSYNSIKDIKEFSIDLSFLTRTTNSTAESITLTYLQDIATNIKCILNHCLLFQCFVLNTDTNINLLEVPTRVKTSLENLFYRNEGLRNCDSDSDTNIIAQYICATEDTWSGRNTFTSFINASRNIFETEHEISKKIIGERENDKKELFYFLCECISVSKNNTTCLHVRLKPLNSDKFIPKLTVFLKNYIPNILNKFYHESQDTK